MQSLNGIGTTFYGKKDVNDDGSYTTTKWFIFLLLPIIPLGSYKIKKISQTKLGGSIEYEILKKLPLNKKQVLTWLLPVYGVILILIVWLILLGINK